MCIEFCCVFILSFLLSLGTIYMDFQCRKSCALRCDSMTTVDSEAGGLTPGKKNQQVILFLIIFYSHIFWGFFGLA